MIRYIENRSHARIAYALAADSQVASGVGHWRVTTEYAEETTFNQECRIVHIEDGVSVLWDPDAILPTREDATWCLVPVDVSRAKFKRKWPHVPASDFTSYDKRYTQFWCGSETIRVGELWEKHPARRRLALYPDGAIHDLTGAPKGREERCRRDGAEIRERAGYRIFRSLITLGHVLEEPAEWPGRYIPIIRVAGEEVRIGRRTVRHGVVRFIKDPAQLYNYARSQQAELYGLAPKAPWLGTEKNFEDSLPEWETANEENWPFLTYKPDPANGNARPERIAPPPTSPGLSEAVMLSARDKQGVTGIYNSSLGGRSNETSGVAISARERQSDVGNVVYVDNFGLGVAHTGAVLLDLIPHVYDTERMVQIQDEDGTVRSVTINRALVPGRVADQPDDGEAIEIGGEGGDADEPVWGERAADSAPLMPADAGIQLAPRPGPPAGEAANAEMQTDDDVDEDGGAAIDLDPQGTRQDNVSPDLDTGDAYDNDVTIGSYQIAFAPGPSYSTRREDARDGMADLIRSAPSVVPLILDLYVKAQDWPMAGEIAERLQAMLPPPVKAMIAMEKARAEGVPLPPGAMSPDGPVPGLPMPGAAMPGAPMPGAPISGAPIPAPPPPNPAQLAGLKAEIAKAQAAEATARLDVEIKAIERDMRALALRAAAAKVGHGPAKRGEAMPNALVPGLAEDIARLHGVIAELVAMIGASRTAEIARGAQSSADDA